MGGRCICLPREICERQWTEGEAHPEGATEDRDIHQDQQKSAAAVVLLPKRQEGPNVRSHGVDSEMGSHAKKAANFL